MVTVYKSSVIDAPIVEVWACIRDFKNLYWKHDDAESHIEEDQPSDKIGCIRHSSLQSGGHLREQLLALSDYHCSVTYAILDNPLGVANYVSTLKLRPITEGNRAFIEWSAVFDCALAARPSWRMSSVWPCLSAGSMR